MTNDTMTELERLNEQIQYLDEEIEMVEKSLERRRTERGFLEQELGRLQALPVYSAIEILEEMLYVLRKSKDCSSVHFPKIKLIKAYQQHHETSLLEAKALVELFFTGISCHSIIAGTVQP